MTAITMMNANQVRSFIEGNKPNSYTLLDVRQEWEYELDHIPGACLLPLVELPDRMEEVPKDLPIIVYCASGGRSMAAASLLEGNGFTDINNLVGGIAAWDGHTAFGPMELGMILFSGSETPVEVVLKAYAMESCLQRFYTERADMAETLERIELYMELAGFEDRHKDTLYQLYLKLSGGDMTRDQFEKTAFADMGIEAEGGVEINEFLERHPFAFDDDQGVLQLATMVEAQALDYYLRCVRRAELEVTKDVLQILAREEKAHLKLLGQFMDKQNL